MSEGQVTILPTAKEIATFFQWVLPYKLADQSDVNSWADRLIEETQSPIPIWLAELAAASPPDAVELSRLLNPVPGDIRFEIVIKMTIAAFYLEFVMHFEQRRELAWELHKFAEM